MTGADVLAGGFEEAFAGPLDRAAEVRHWLVQSDGHRVPLPVQRWHGRPEPAAAIVVAAVRRPDDRPRMPAPAGSPPPLAERGLIALGVDISAAARPADPGPRRRP
ncbi:hypothetical protein JNW88_07080, partial [Micromonospora sp. ATA32]|nr:hypothetical protein [Micromonospora sp. ATA32]